VRVDDLRDQDSQESDQGTHQGRIMGYRSSKTYRKDLLISAADEDYRRYKPYNYPEDTRGLDQELPVRKVASVEQRYQIYSEDRD
jgi:hypothetical protein